MHHIFAKASCWQPMPYVPDSNPILTISEIRYSQHTINESFHNGAPLFPPALRSFGPLKVVRHQGLWYAINNRMLYVLNKFRCVDDYSWGGGDDGFGEPSIMVAEVEKTGSFFRQLTTTDNGHSVAIRGHCSCGAIANPHCELSNCRIIASTLTLP